jgi:hypothetical protein
MSARKHFSRMSALFLFDARATKERVLHLRECAKYIFLHFLKRTLCLISCIPFVNRMALAKVSIELIAIYFPSSKIFIIPIGETAFCKPELITIDSNYFQNAQKGECFWIILKH